MGEVMEAMMTIGSADKYRYTSSAGHSSSPPSPPGWKLYDNPHYADRSAHHSLRKHHHPYACLSSSSRSSYHGRDLSAFASARPMERDVNLSDLDNALAEIKELRAELEFERRVRRRAEALNRALAREMEDGRARREAAEETCRRMGEEIAGVREEAERAMREVEDERRMLRMAEALREERVQMKLSEARFLMEEKIKEMMPPEKREMSPARNNGDGAQRREVENPHIKRGIKGVEFPRAVRVRGGAGVGSSPGSREARGGNHLGSNLECQRAQLRVLMRHKSPASSGIVRDAAEHLVM